jgi:nicotinate-nucleotide adenylyltransferase
VTSDQRIGILGGTFDPIHRGHLDAASQAMRSIPLDRIIFMPSRTPPHRTAEPRASSYHRFAMAALAADEVGDMTVSDLELRRDGPSYTSMTLEQLHADGIAPSALYFILGADAFAEIETWHDYPRILEMSNFVVISRPGIPMPNPERIPHPDPSAVARTTSIVFIEADTPDISSSDIRRRIATGQPIDDLVPSSVAHHIQRHRLYTPASVAAVS